MTNALLVTAVVSFLCAGLWGQSASPRDTSMSAAPASPTENHARDPVGFEVQDKRESDGVYPDDVVSTIRAHWYQLVSELRQASYDQQGVTIVEFRIKRDGSLAKLAIAETSKEERLDGAALNAVRSASPFKPLPKNFAPNTTSQSLAIPARRHCLGFTRFITESRRLERCIPPTLSTPKMPEKPNIRALLFLASPWAATGCPTMFAF